MITNNEEIHEESKPFISIISDNYYFKFNGHPLSSLQYFITLRSLNFTPNQVNSSQFACIQPKPTFTCLEHEYSSFTRFHPFMSCSPQKSQIWPILKKLHKNRAFSAATNTKTVILEKLSEFFPQNRK